MVVCCVPFCKSNSSRNTGEKCSFHGFPIDPIIKQKWLNNISRIDIEGLEWRPTHTSCVCSRHFLEADYSPLCKIKRLNADAVPWIFPDYPPHKRPKIPKKRHVITRIKPSPQIIKQRVVELPLAPTPAPLATETTITLDHTYVEVIDEHQPKTTNASTQTFDKEKNKLLETNKKKEVYRLRARRLQIKTEKQTEEIQKLHNKLQQTEAKLNSVNLDAIEKDSSDGNLQASFLLEQLQAYGKKKFKWAHSTVRTCADWHAKSPDGYLHAQKAGLLNLPSASTLRRHNGTLVEASENNASFGKQNQPHEPAVLINEENCVVLIVNEIQDGTSP